ncbi:phospho-sugar mutase [Salsipaludibacter albus]|uniref:phospho-sugar mutase n=1 Tax=Salsipaludibacter albus TaxID=2849650 RepID=UPI001EE4688B|nr:phospho-sugar mutase [Salsipaludibacter albus]MBY5163562.1 phospho-sugar mutase [Salsipaludibacter albus]
MDQELLARARAWVAGDPDRDSAAQLQAMVDAGAEEALRDHVAGDLAFGTAGLRGAVGPGPDRMNRAVVIRATRGLADHLLATVDGARERGVAVGFDARPDSERFAHDVMSVLLAAGFTVHAHLTPTATPLVAFAARRLSTAAAVVVTASHNPPADNGYKVYDQHGVQITPPDDRLIAEAIAAVGPAVDVPGVGDGIEGVHELGEEAMAAYVAAITADEVVAAPRGDHPSVPLVVTPMHGVGGGPVERILQARGHHVVRVDGQWEPDGRFPTVDFPNPEEPGALDLAEATATDVGAAVILANDPDADRLAVAVPTAQGWRRLSGDEVGCVFAHHLLSRTGGDLERPLVASSIVSSARLGRIAAAFDARHEVTLTGFKWLWRAGRELADQGWHWVMGYEEALGYSLGDAVRDKDGINAAATMADLVVELAAEGRVLVDLLADLDERYGRWANVQASVRRTGATGADEILAAVDAATRVDGDALGMRTIERVVDHRAPTPDAPAWRPTTPLVVWHLSGGGRVLVRPSGTEPKLKVYVDLPLDDGEEAGLGDVLAGRTVELLGIGD